MIHNFNIIFIIINIITSSIAADFVVTGTRIQMNNDFLQNELWYILQMKRIKNLLNYQTVNSSAAIFVEHQKCELIIAEWERYDFRWNK